MTDAFNARNQETLHDTALTSDAMNAKNMDIYSWTALKNTAFRHTSTASQDAQKPPHQIKL